MIGDSSPLLALLIGTILVLFAATLAFGGVVFLLHFRNERRATVLTAREREWEPALLQVLTGQAPAESLRQRVDAAHELHFVNFLGRYARRMRGAERETLVQLAAPLLPRVAARLRHKSPEVRARAVQSLASLGLQRYAPALIEALDDPSYLVAMRAVRGLAQRDHPEFAPAVLARLERFQLWNPRFVAATLAGMGPAAAPALRRSLADAGEPPRARAVAAGALTTLRDLESAPAAAGALAASPDPDLQQAALLLLGSVGGAEHIALLSSFTDHPVPFVRAAALEALARIGSTDDLEQVERALDDASPWVALTVGQALAEARHLKLLRRVAAGSGQAATVAREVLAEAEP